MPLFLTLLTPVFLFVCVCHGPVFSAAAVIRPNRATRRVWCVLIRANSLCGPDMRAFRALIRSAAWLHSNLTPLWKMITIAVILHTARISSACLLTWPREPISHKRYTCAFVWGDLLNIQEFTKYKITFKHVHSLWEWRGQDLGPGWPWVCLGAAANHITMETINSLKGWGKQNPLNSWIEQKMR